MSERDREYLESVREAARRLPEPFRVYRDGEGWRVQAEGASAAPAVPALRDVASSPGGPSANGGAWVPALALGDLGDRSFCADLGIRYPVLGGSMANGISSFETVEALGQAGMLGFFGAGGLVPSDVSAALDRIVASAGVIPYGCNLIHNPSEPSIEAATVDLFIRRGVRLVEASAYLELTLSLLRYRLHGIRREGDRIVTPNRVVAKASRVEVATKFLSPAPEAMLRELVASGDLTAEQGELAAHVPVAQDLTAEADSGGHTDNRPAIALLPTMLTLRDRLQAKYNYAEPLRIGAAGGIATPAAAAAAFAMGAAYVLLGTVNQACVESGTSDAVRRMLADAGQADVAMAPSADMFEMGVALQVLKRGTMFPMRAAKLYEIYRTRAGLDEIPASERATLEKTVFQKPLDEVWEDTRRYFAGRDASQIERAERDPKHRMALVFRWYLGQSARWAIDADPGRRLDYQVWCGPGIGAFNEWARGSFLEAVENRAVATVAMNLLYGAAVLTRLNMLRFQGAHVPREAMAVEPLEMGRIEEYAG